jgi:hypothetical protein
MIFHIVPQVWAESKPEIREPAGRFESGDLQMKSMRKYFFIALAFLAAAALLRFWIAPLALELPADYTNLTRFTAEDRFRETPDGIWQEIRINAWRMDQALVSTNVIVLQADLHWNTADTDAVIFESSGLYGVDRHTRMNVPTYGNVERSGQFLFPPHLEKKGFTLWDPMFIEPRNAAFDRVETLDGMLVYVFRFSGTGMDETAGYSSLPEVPERYLALTDGQGTLWIEPVSGVLVDYEEQGVSYFAEKDTKARLANFHEWSDRYTPETKTAQMALARASRLRILALEIWLPGGFALAGFLLLVSDLTRRIKPRRAKQ